MVKIQKKSLLLTALFATTVSAHQTALHVQDNTLLHWLTESDHLAMLIGGVAGVVYGVYRWKCVK